MAEMRWQQQQMKKALNRLTKRLLSRAFQSWRSTVEAMAAQGDRCKVSLSLWLNGTLWRGMEMWRQNAGCSHRGDGGNEKKELVRLRSLWLLGVWGRQRRLLMRHVIYHVQAKDKPSSPLRLTIGSFKGVSLQVSMEEPVNGDVWIGSALELRSDRLSDHNTSLVT